MEKKSSDDLFQELGMYGSDKTLSLMMGAPGPKLLTKCGAILEKATKHRLEQETANGYIFQYGPSLGDLRYRENLAGFLSERYGEKVRMENIMVTCGASHGLYTTTSLFFRKGCRVFIEDPTYFIAINVLRKDLHMEVVPVPLDEDGMIIDNLEKQLSDLPVRDEANYYRAMVYLIPAYQNPTGICYSEKRFKELVDLAIKYDVLLLCDDVYNLLHYGQTPPPKPLFFTENLTTDNQKGHVISNCTFSKILAPGLRLGWIQSSPYVLKIFSESGFVRSGGNFNNYTSGIMASALELGLQTEHLNTLIDVYTKRMISVADTLRVKLPPGCAFNTPQGGYFFWITLPSRFNAEKFSNWLKDHYQVGVQPGNKCSALGNFTNCVRIAITFLEDDELETAVERFCEGLKNYMNMSF